MNKAMPNLAQAYGQTLNKDQILKDYARLVQRIAHQMISRLPPSVQVDDLIQVGMMGLLDAASRFEDTHGAQFETYVGQRIHGAMLDELRSIDWVPRSLRKDMRKIEKSIDHLQQSLGRHPSESEIAQHLNIQLLEYQRLLQDSRGAQLMYYEDFESEDKPDFLDQFDLADGSDPLSILEDDQFKTALARGIDGLPEREKLMMGLMYEQEMNLKEAGVVLGVSESRVSQLHSQAVSRLRAGLSGF